MKEATLRAFFEGTIGPRELAADVAGSESHPSPGVTITHVENMVEDFEITRHMAVLLCDAVLSSQLEPSALRTIGFAVVASDRFSFDGEDVLGEVLHDWACPEVNYPLTIENVRKFKMWLEGVEPYPVKR